MTTQERMTRSFARSEIPYFFLEALLFNDFALVVLLTAFLWTVVFLLVVLFLLTVTFFFELTLPGFTLLAAVVFFLAACVATCVVVACASFDVPANAMDGAANKVMVAKVVKSIFFTRIPPLILDLANYWPYEEYRARFLKKLQTPHCVRRNGILRTVLKTWNVSFLWHVMTVLGHPKRGNCHQGG